MMNALDKPMNIVLSRIFSFRRGVSICSHALLFVALNAPAASSRPAATTATNAPSRLDYDSFRIVNDRNIFDPNRTSRSKGGEAPPAPKIDAFALVGTLNYEKGQFAFFDGTSSQYKKAAKAGDTIAGYTVADIETKQVKLKSADKELDFPIGMQLRRENEGEWKMSEKTDEFTAPNNVSYSRGESSSRGNSGSLRDLFSQSFSGARDSLGRGGSPSFGDRSSTSRGGSNGRGGEPFSRGGDSSSRGGDSSSRGDFGSKGRSRGSFPGEAPAADSTANASKPAENAPSAPATDPAEALRRLMEKRRQETK
jgi:hypothetical protein